jgi:hypothetical protein
VPGGPSGYVSGGAAYENQNQVEDSVIENRRMETNINRGESTVNYKQVDATIVNSSVAPESSSFTNLNADNNNGGAS